MGVIAHDNASVMEDVWTPQRIARFWDMVAQEPKLHHMYFSLHHAKSIINVARLFGMTGGKVMDYGCGSGYLSRELVNSGFQTTGIEYSLESANAANALMNGLPGWNGCFTNDTIPDLSCENGFDWVFSVEAYEHLRDEWINGYFLAIKKYLKPGGMLVITVPNNENLNDSLIICPCCEAKFHRWGHLRSVTLQSLARVVNRYGFEVELCHELNLELMHDLESSFLDILLSRFVFTKYVRKSMSVDNRLRIMAIERKMRDTVHRPHLVLIARKVS